MVNVKRSESLETYDPDDASSVPAKADLSPGMAMNAAALGTAQASAIARETAKIQAAFVMAERNPRDENLALTKLAANCKNVRFADSAIWSYPRGGKTLTGPSIHLARACATAWKNVLFGFDVEGRDEDYVTLSAYAIDVEANVHSRASQRVRRLIQRRVRGKDGVSRTEWVQPDERDELELVNRIGSKLVRRCIFEVVPGWLVDLALEKAKATIKHGMKDAKTREDRIRAMLIAFADLAVTPDMIAEKYGRQVADLTADDLTDLSAVYRSMTSGELSLEQAFPVEEERSKVRDPDAPTKEQTAAANLEDLLDAEEGAAAEKAKAAERPKAETSRATAAGDDDGSDDGPFEGISTKDLLVEEDRLRSALKGRLKKEERATIKSELSDLEAELKRREGGGDDDGEEEEAGEAEEENDSGSPFGTRDEMIAELRRLGDDGKSSKITRSMLNGFCKKRDVKKVGDLSDVQLAEVLGQITDALSVAEED